MVWNEDELHRWLLARPAPRGLVGSRGDDAAVLRALRGQPVLCADQTVEGVHFAVGTSAARAGRKAASRALSDLAACAAEPRALLIALAAPRSTASAYLKRLLAAAADRGREYGADLVGGDLCCSPGPLTVAVTALGERRGGRSPGRDRARAGERVVLSGPVGGSSAGRHLSFRPRVREGLWLGARGCSALMDTTDGLARDLWRMARASAVRIDLEDVPVHIDARRLTRSSGRTPLWHALHDGEDHELLATVPKARLARIVAEAPQRCPELTVVGRVRAGRGLWVREGGRLRRWRSSEGGWVHGTGRDA